MTKAVLDACVLYSAPMRDLFMHLTIHKAFQPVWTEKIHAEWMENILKNRPDLSRVALERIRALMNERGGDWEAPGYEALIPLLRLPDADDRHVLAAAITSRTAIIVTFNRKDFPKAALAPYVIEAQNPDTFLCLLFVESPSAVLSAVQTHRASLRKPPKTIEEYLSGLERQGLKKFRALLEPFQTEL